MPLEEIYGEIFIPESPSLQEALERTTYLGLGAHHDDLEIMALPGILEAFGKEDLHFTGVVLTNGSGSPCTGPYRDLSKEELIEIRKKEQKKAAMIGEYSAQILLEYTSEEIKDTARGRVEDTIQRIIRRTTPEIIYTHNLADKHETHVAVSVRVMEAIKALPYNLHPKKIYGCEVWRDLDWLPHEEKVVFDVSGWENLASSLLGVYDSQIRGGKRYDLAIEGRRRAHATLSKTHETDRATSLIYAMDLTPLLKKDGPSLEEYVLSSIDRFANNVKKKISLFKE